MLDVPEDSTDIFGIVFLCVPGVVFFSALFWAFQAPRNPGLPGILPSE